MFNRLSNLLPTAEFWNPNRNSSTDTSSDIGPMENNQYDAPNMTEEEKFREKFSKLNKIEQMKFMSKARKAKSKSSYANRKNNKGKSKRKRR